MGEISVSFPGMVIISLQASRRFKASLTGVRLMLKAEAISVSIIFSPLLSFPSTIQRQRKLYILSEWPISEGFISLKGIGMVKLLGLIYKTVVRRPTPRNHSLAQEFYLVKNFPTSRFTNSLRKWLRHRRTFWLVCLTKTVCHRPVFFGVHTLQFLKGLIKTLAKTKNRTISQIKIFPKPQKRLPQKATAFKILKLEYEV